jgi:hypothetical protein
VQRTLLPAAFDVDLGLDTDAPDRGWDYDREGHDVQSCRKPAQSWKTSASAPGKATRVEQAFRPASKTSKSNRASAPEATKHAL